MVKKDLVGELAVRTGMTQKDVKGVIDELIDVVQDTLSKGESITLVGLGTFLVKNYSERIVNSPMTNSKDMVIPARKMPKFRPSTSLKDVIR